MFLCVLTATVAAIWILSKGVKANFICKKGVKGTYLLGTKICESHSEKILFHGLSQHSTGLFLLQVGPVWFT